ncbi:uncharacterized protein PRCAT00001091001 [Priceomyces carsonii]|uniref:uncharacterized protein n=1 Tax=Priceomyces carsonii TaxID=28549 RepID=UPI002EDA967F|nr:unnamed protein product [Priceomyces carsonii]
MTSQIEPTAASVVSAPDGGAAFQRHFSAHCKEYPILLSTRNMVLSLPLSLKIASTVAPHLSSVRETQPIKTVMDKGDLIADGALGKIDKHIPSLKTLEVHDLTDPVTRPINGAIDSVKAKNAIIVDSLLKNLVEPSVKTVNEIKGKFHSTLYDAEGKCVITSVADPMVAPVNQKLDQLVEAHYPDIKKVPKEGQSSELSRTAQIVYNLVTRAHNSPAETSEENESAPKVNEQPSNSEI